MQSCNVAHDAMKLAALWLGEEQVAGQLGECQAWSCRWLRG